MYKKILMVVFMIATLVLPTNTIHAQENLAGLSPYDYAIYGPNGRVLYVDDFIIVSQSNTLDRALAATGCLSYTLGKTYYNAVGVAVFRYSQQISWCWNGSVITSVSHQHIPEVYHFLYKYNGIIGNTHSGGVNYSYFRAYSQANFCEFAPVIGCVWYVYPWVDQTVYKNGTYTGSTGG